MAGRVGPRISAIVKTIACLLAAAAVPAVAVCGYSTSTLARYPTLYAPKGTEQIQIIIGTFVIAFIVAFADVVLLGLPAFLLGLRFRAIRWWSCLIVGFTIGTAPLIAAQAIFHASNFELAFALPFGYSGALGGFTFWLLWRLWVRAQSRLG